MRRAVVAAAVAALTAPVPVARAQEPGVTVDPSSPSGSEYSIPLDSTRNELGGRSPSSNRSSPTGSSGTRSASTASDSSSSGSAPLFGAGVGGSGSSGGGGTPAKASAKKPGAKQGSSDSGDPGGAASPVLRATAEKPLSTDDGGSSVWPLLGAAGGLLLAGAAAGLVVRRRQS
jgi:hypothetical protein